MSESPSGFEETPGRIDIALAIPIREGKFLVAQRAAGLHLAGHWEFPGGKVASGEQPMEAARRELREETGLVAERLDPLVVLVHDYVEIPLRLHVFLARDPCGDVQLDVERPFAWKSFDELLQLKMPEANRQILRALRWRQ